MDLWRDMCGLEPKRERHIPSLEELKKTEWCSEFEQLMRNRLIMGALRYGPITERTKYNYIAAAIDKLKLYSSTGNAELLVDCANYCLKEFVVGAHPNKHFYAHDDKNHAIPMELK